MVVPSTSGTDGEAGRAKGVGGRECGGEARRQNPARRRGPIAITLPRARSDRRSHITLHPHNGLQVSAATPSTPPLGGHPSHSRYPHTARRRGQTKANIPSAQPTKPLSTKYLPVRDRVPLFQNFSARNHLSQEITSSYRRESRPLAPP